MQDILHYHSMQMFVPFHWPRRHESEIESTETLLKRSTSVELMQLNELMDKILKNRDDGFFRELYFVQNHKLFDFVRAEQIGSLKDYLSTQRRAQQSSADGKEISEAIVGLEAHLVVTTGNKKSQPCYDNNDCVTLEVRNRQGDSCAAEVRVQDNKDCTYKITYFAKEAGAYSASVKLNGVSSQTQTVQT